MAFPFAALAAAAPTPAKPNIIFVLFDDLGYGQPTCFRKDSDFTTPNLDRLAREGMRFTDAHAAASLCTPTRYGVLTGRYPSRIGQYGVLTTYSPPIIERERLTVGKFLQQQGYHTACFGKWHLGMNWSARHGKGESDAEPVGTSVTDGPTTRGFDLFWGYTHARNIGMIMENDRVVTNVEPVEVQPLLARRVVEHIDARARAGSPFFMYVPLSPPHTPIVPAPDFAGKTHSSDKEAGYGDWLYQGDWVLGQILAALERNRLAENTLIIATSDNGAAGRPYPPLRGAKASIWEGGHREPFIARWPGKIKVGAVCDDVICHNDLMATCAELLGAKLPPTAGEDSVSILPDLLGTAKGPVREATVHQSGRGDLAIRQGPWKLVFLKSGERALYNLKADLGETQNVAAANPDVVKRLTGLMERYISNGRSTPGAAQKNKVQIRLDGTAKPAKGKKKRDQVIDPRFD